jgi:hypothetical protein
MKLSKDQIAILQALRAATHVKRAPSVLKPDGREDWHTLTWLAEGEFLAIPPGDLARRADLSAAARGLYRQRLVAQRTMHTVVYLAILDSGRDVLRDLEARAGVTEAVRAQLAALQAEEDFGRAQDAYDAADAALREARDVVRARHAASHAAQLTLGALGDRTVLDLVAEEAGNVVV